MQKLISKLAVMMLSVLVLAVPMVGIEAKAYAAEEPVLLAAEGDEAVEGPTSPGSGDKTSILPDDWGVSDILNLVLNIVVYGLGAAAVLGVIIAGIMYMTARDNEAQVAKAKTRLFEVVIGLVAWAVMYAVLNWLIPGGLNTSITDDKTKGGGSSFVTEPSQDVIGNVKVVA